MRWLFRISLSLAFLGLALLAVWPYLPNLQKEWEGIYATWQQVRADKAKGVDATPEPKELQSESKPVRSRELLSPKAPAPTLEPAGTSGDDPFLAEARRRAEADPEAAMQWLQSQSTGSERLRGMLEVVALWAAEDSESALLWLESNAQGLARLETLNSGVELWAETDPTAAADWIDGMANDGSKLAAAKSLAGTWVHQDPEAAALWVEGLAPGPVKTESAAALAKAWAESDPEAASIWAFAQAEFTGETELLVDTVQSYTRKDPKQAENFLRQIAEAYNAPGVIEGHVIARAEEDPVATAEWLSQLAPTDPIYAPEYAGSLMQVWASSDSIAASTWLSQQPAGAQRDAAVAGFSETIQNFEPEAAAAWANTIQDPERRIQRLEASVQTWARTHPVEALEWVKNAELEPALREQLAREIPWD